MLGSGCTVKEGVGTPGLDRAGQSAGPSRREGSSQCKEARGNLSLWGQYNQRLEFLRAAVVGWEDRCGRGAES